ncbi:hypothetical protein TKK_0011919 [Trichogramma kaykai]
MKWLHGAGSAGAGEPAPNPMQLQLQQGNGHLPSDNENCPQVMAGGDALRLPPGQINRVQDDGMVGYVFQRTADEFGVQAFQNKQTPRAWALADEGIVDNNQEKWKYSVNKMGVPQQNQQPQLNIQPMNNVHMPYEIHPMQLKSGTPGAEHMVYLNSQITAQQQQLALFHQHQQYSNGQIAPSAKKLWGVDDGSSKDDGGVKGGGILPLGEQMWRDSTWSTSDHAVSQPISMGSSRRVGVGSGYHQTSEVGAVLSPRSSEASGLGVKMVEYVLGSSPTNSKELDQRMVSLRLNDNDKKDKDKGAASPFDNSKDDNCPQGNGLTSQNGLDDDKGFNRTPGSRQPSPGEEEFQKNATLAVSTGAGGVVLLKPGVDVMGTGEEHFMQAFAPAPPHMQHHQAPPTHHMQQAPSHAAQLFGAQGPPQGPPLSQQQHQQQQGPPQPQDQTGHFDVQVSFIFELFSYLQCS